MAEGDPLGVGDGDGVVVAGAETPGLGALEVGCGCAVSDVVGDGEGVAVALGVADGLGLADVVTQEAGGADLDTLFVDEGFGALDADTLDDVMDTLDSLRDGGRVVGVVSHVAEMRDRIPTQLLVSKSRVGSTVAITR